MKRITFLTAFLISTITCFGQRIEINGFGTTNLSGKTVELSSAQISAFGKTRLRDKIPSPSFLKHDAKVYGVGNVLVSVRYVKLKRNVDPSTYLAGLKKVLDPIFSHDDGYTSKIETINGKKFLITRQPMHGNITKAFYGVNTSTLACLQGSVQCTPEDEAEANTMLRELLTNLKYKVQ